MIKEKIIALFLLLTIVLTTLIGSNKVLAATVPVTGTVTVDNQTPNASQIFTFQLKDGSGNVKATAKNGANSKNFTFPATTFDSLGNGTYTVEQLAEPAKYPNMTFDNRKATVVINEIVSSKETEIRSNITNIYAKGATAGSIYVMLPNGTRLDGYCIAHSKRWPSPWTAYEESYYTKYTATINPTPAQICNVVDSVWLGNNDKTERALKLLLNYFDNNPVGQSWSTYKRQIYVTSITAAERGTDYDEGRKFVNSLLNQPTSSDPDYTLVLLTPTSIVNNGAHYSNTSTSQSQSLIMGFNGKDKTVTFNPVAFNNTSIVRPVISFTKQNMQGANLSGGRFGIYTDVACQTPARGWSGTTAGTDANLVNLTWNNNGNTSQFIIKDDGTYYLKELNPPDGYQALANPITFKVSNGQVTIVNNPDTNKVALNNGKDFVIKNDLITTPVTIEKQDMQGAALSGARFGLYKDAACQTPAKGWAGNNRGNLNTTNDLVWTFNNTNSYTFVTAEDGEFYLKELTPPPGGYIALDRPIKIKIDKGNLTIVDNPYSNKVSLTDKTITVKNEKPVTNVSLSIRKTVTGNMSETNANFQFSVKLSQADGTAFVGPITTQKTDANNQVTTNNNQTLTDGSFTFELGHNETLKIVDIPTGSKYTITETKVDGYTCKIDGTVDDDASIEGTLTADTIVNYENNKEILINTGFSNDFAPFIILISIAGAFAITFFFLKKRREV